MINKVKFVKAHFRPLYEKQGFLKSVFRTPQAGTILETPEGMEQKGWSTCQIDGERLEKEVSEEVVQLNKDGFEVVSINGVNSGSFKSDYSSAEKSAYGWGYGFTYSEGVLIVAKKNT